MSARAKTALSAETDAAISGLGSMWRQLDSIRSVSLGPIEPCRPAGFFTFSEYRIRYGLKETAARRQLAGLVESGKLVKKRVMLPDILGRLIVTAVYGIS